MAKTTKDLEKTLEKNLEYIGLDLNKIPTFLKKVDLLNHMMILYIRYIDM